MEYGVSVGPFPEGAERVPEKFEFIEISVGEHEIKPEEINSKELKHNLEKKNLDLVVHLPFRQPLATEIEEFNSTVIEYFERILVGLKTEGLKPEKAVIHANMRDRDSEDEREELRKQISDLQRIGEKLGTELCFENVRHVDTPELAEVGEILDKLDASMCFDIGHAFISSEQEEVEEFLENYSHLISHLHIHDIRERGDSHISVGEGEIDFEMVCEKLSDFDGTACYEIFTGDNDYIELAHEKFSEHFE